MERLLQYLDDLDDLYGMVGLLTERLRRLLLALLSYILISTGAIGGIGFAIVHPPLATATSILLFVTLLYRSVVSAPVSSPRTT